jgi:hypothetical protein
VNVERSEEVVVQRQPLVGALRDQVGEADSSLVPVVRPVRDGRVRLQAVAPILEVVGTESDKRRLARHGRGLSNRAIKVGCEREIARDQPGHTLAENPQEGCAPRDKSSFSIDKEVDEDTLIGRCESHVGRC